jgi:membrane protein implicated in regulation of membrane protease activity
VTPVRRPARRRDQLLGLALTGALLLAIGAAAVALVVGLGLFVVAMPLTTAAIAAVAAWAGWRVVRRRRRVRGRAGEPG